MRNQFFLFLIALLFLCLQSQFSHAEEEICYVSGWNSYVNESEIDCFEIRFNGRSLDAVLRQHPYSVNLRNQTFDEIASTVISIRVVSKDGDVSISENGLNGLTKLKKISLESEREHQLNISPNEFRNTPNLKEISLAMFDLTNDTVLAIENAVANQLTTLGMRMCTQTENLFFKLEKLANTYKLVNIDIMWAEPELHNCTMQLHNAIMIKNAPLRVEAFDRLHRGLTHLYIVHSQLPTITSTMLHDMKNLTLLYLVNDTISTIEPLAFDDLITVHGLNLRDNKIKRLPDGLFGKMKKLQWIYMPGNGVEGLSQANFTHCDDFMMLTL